MEAPNNSSPHDGVEADLRVAWVFHSAEARDVFPCGFGSSRELAEQWIVRVNASGTLSAFVMDESAYDSNIRLGRLRMEKADRMDIVFQRKFSTAIDHVHY